MAEEAATTETTGATTEQATTAAATTTEQGNTSPNLEAARAADAETARVAALTPEQKAAEAKAAEAKATETKADTPADYSKLTLPEGYKTDDPVFADAVKLFGDEKISPAQAQKLLDFTVERDKAIGKAVADANLASWNKQTGEWKETAGKEFNEAQLGDAKTALAQVFDKETITYFESMGFTNHPGLIRGMVKVSKAIKDDTFVGGNAAQASGSDARSSFPNSNMNP